MGAKALKPLKNNFFSKKVYLLLLRCIVMRFEKKFPHSKHFFQEKKILSERLAFFFIIEETVLLFLMVLQLYFILGIKFYPSGELAFFVNPFSPMQLTLFLLTLVSFIISYTLVALRDETVRLIHHNFSRLVFSTIKLKFQFTSKEILAMALSELILAVLIGISIYLYLDPEVNLVPAPLNYIFFAIICGIALLIFSQSKGFRFFVYGQTPIQKKLNLGNHRLERSTNKKTGSMRFRKK